jgi:hypothetical protein
MPKAKKNIRTYLIPKLDVEFRFLPETINVEQRTVEMVLTTSNPVRMFGWDVGEFVEVLSMKSEHIRWGRAENGLPTLDCHWRIRIRDQIGIVEKTWLDGEKMKGLVRFSKRESVEDIFQDIVDRIYRNGSIGYRVYKYQDITQGDDARLPTLLAIDWEPIEFSLVPVGADPDAGVRSVDGETESDRSDLMNECEVLFRNLSDEGENEMNPRLFRKMLMDKAGDNTGGGGAVPTPAAAAAPPTPALLAPDNGAVRAEGEKAGAQAERARAKAIRDAVRAARLGDAFAEELIEKGVDINQARADIFAKMAENPSNATEIRAHNPSVTVGTDGRERWLRAAGDWLMVRAGISAQVEKHLGRKLDPADMRGMSLYDMARESLERAGVRVRGTDKMTVVGMAFTGRSAAGMVASDFPVLLEEAMHKVMLASYATQADTWRRFSWKTTVSDFRPHNFYRIGSLGRLDRLSELGEFKKKTLSDATKASIEADTVGNLVNISRKMVVNDDMGVFSQLGPMLGRASGLSIELDVYDLLGENAGLGPALADGKTLFHADHKNIITPAGAPSVETFGALDAAMSSQLDTNKEVLDISPSIFLGPKAAAATAKVVNGAQYDPDTANKLQKPNQVQNMFSDIVGTARLTGKAWYGFADPSVVPVIVVSFLDGQENPVLESKDGWDVDGISWKVRHDYGIDVVDFRGAARNAGQ